MKNIVDEIQIKKAELANLESEYAELLKSVTEHWKNNFLADFRSKCEMIYHLMQGKVYNPFSLADNVEIKRAENWKTKEQLDYCDIYKGRGFPTGFISLKSGLYDATSSRHKEMWISAIKDNRESRSLEDFKKNLKKDHQFLLDIFEITVKEEGSRVFNTKPYIEEFENKKLKTGKYYIFEEDTTRKY